MDTLDKEQNVKIVFEPDGNQTRVHKGTSILKAARAAGNLLRSECGGNGKCGKCRIIVKNQLSLSELTIHERKQLTQLEIDSGYRLACQALVIGNTVVLVPPESRVESRKIQVAGYERTISLDPAVRKIHLHLSKPSLNDNVADLERLMAHLEDSGLSIEVTLETLRTLPSLLRESSWDVTVTIWNNEKMINVEPGDTSSELYGAAIDVGTSKIVVYLVNLVSGETLGTGSVENPQIMFGEDLLTRAVSVSEDKNGLMMLQGHVIEGINEALKNSVEMARIDPFKVSEAIVVGNTVMHHLLLGLDTKNLVIAPFTPVIKREVTTHASKLGIGINPRAVIDVPPLLAGFVGSDALADVLVTGINDSAKISLLLDIGTNTEIFIGNSEGIIACSCASGPAFEGGHIRHGVKAVTGAIERVSIDPVTLKAIYKTIGGAKPRGLCGSAMIDIVSELWRNQLIDKTGLFHPRSGSPAFRKIDGITEFIIVSASESATENEIVVTQNDVNEIQRAKAAIFAGYSILLKRKNLLDSDVERVYVAGAFGHNLDPENAKTIGLLPPIPTDQIKFVGNTAVTGAKMALTSRDARDNLDELSLFIDYLELSTDPLFKNEYASALFIPHRDMKRYNKSIL